MKTIEEIKCPLYDGAGFAGNAIMGTNHDGEPAMPFYFQGVSEDLQELGRTFGEQFTVTFLHDHDCLLAEWANESYEFEIHVSTRPEVRHEEQIDPCLDQTFKLRAFDVWERGAFAEQKLVAGKAWDSTCAAIARKFAEMKIFNALEFIKPKATEID